MTKDILVALEDGRADTDENADILQDVTASGDLNDLAQAAAGPGDSIEDSARAMVATPNELREEFLEALNLRLELFNEQAIARPSHFHQTYFSVKTKQLTDPSCRLPESVKS